MSRVPQAGFSISDLLVLIATGAVMGILVSAGYRLQRGWSLKTNFLANGTGIYKSIFAEVADVQAELHGHPEAPLPRSPQREDPSKPVFETSTDYFKYLVSEEILRVHWSYFAGPRVPAAPGKFDPEATGSADEFQSEHNMWCVVAELKEEDTNAPFLLSRNLQATRLIPTGDDSVKPELEGLPYQSKRMLVIRMGGAGQFIKRRDLTWAFSTPPVSRT